ncbi:MAG: metal ABC transporter permease, partial [Gammaproteobacteria bacterium]
MDWQSLDPSILGPAFGAGLLVLATHVPLGREVLRRGIIFIDLAVAQIAGLGMLVAQIHSWPFGGWGVQGAAAGAALLGALLLGWLDSRWPEVQEALIGIVFVLAATGSLLLIAHSPHGGEHIKDLLSGQILWVTWSQLLPVALLYGLLLALWFGLPWLRRGLAFYLVFALAITASVQLVGVYLVFASLIVPALAARGRDRWPGL